MDISRLGARGLDESLSLRERGPDRTKPHAAERAGRPATGDRVELSREAERMHADRQILKAAFGATETEVNRLLEEDLFEKAGKSKYLASIENPTDLSPEATADRILGGITGYIFGAFQLAHPDMTLEEFDRFASAALSGFERGLGEAKETIDGLGKLDDSLAADIGKTEELVRKGLDEFFASERERLRASTSTTASAPPG